MSHSVVRLTLYTLISAIETDFRGLLRTEVLPNRPLEELFTTDLVDRLKERAARDGSDGSVDLLHYLDYADTLSALNAGRQFLDPSAQKVLKSFNSALEKMTAVRNRVMHSRPLQYTDYSFTIDLTTSLLTYPKHLFPELTRTEQRLKQDPASVLSFPLPPPSDIDANLNHNLPLPDFDETGFLGRADETRQLLTAIRGPWPIITIVGKVASARRPLRFGSLTSFSMIPPHASTPLSGRPQRQHVLHRTKSEESTARFKIRWAF
jgi:LuxR family glucitol operon transcriptional activator